MAIIKTTTIPAIERTEKEVVTQITFQGQEMDLGQGTIYIQSSLRLVEDSAPTYPPVLDANGNKQYTGGTDSLELDIATELSSGITIDGISLLEVYSFLSKWTDYKKGETVDGLVINAPAP